jgi:cellulose biosynthesis protein BcsQ
MERINVLLADTDVKYLIPLERKFIDEFGEMADISIITDKDYLNTFFNTPQSLDILLIGEGLYDQSFLRHDIANLFILSDNSGNADITGSLETNYIYKYTSVKEIFNEVVNNLSAKKPLNLSIEKETKIVLAYSPVGGIGKTTVAIGISGALAKSHKKVLFMSIDSLQSFGFLLPDREAMASGAERLITLNSGISYEAIYPYIRTGIFDYLPPFSKALSALSIRQEHYFNLAATIKEANDYDFIIIDMPGDFTQDTTRFMGFANNTIIVAGQDMASVCKLECLLNNIDCSDRNRFLFICNKYISENENLLVGEKMIKKCRINEYVEFMKEEDIITIENLISIKSLQKVAMLLI